MEGGVREKEREEGRDGRCGGGDDNDVLGEDVERVMCGAME